MHSLGAHHGGIVMIQHQAFVSGHIIAPEASAGRAADTG